jgi:hypothetical protein
LLSGRTWSQFTVTISKVLDEFVQSDNKLNETMDS